MIDATAEHEAGREMGTVERELPCTMTREGSSQETWTGYAGQQKSPSHIRRAPLSGFEALTPQLPGEGKDEPAS